MHVFDKFIYLRVAFATDIEKIVFLTFLLIRRSLVNFMSQGMSFRKAVQPIGRGLLFSYPLIKVYQSLPNGMKDDGTRSFVLGAEAIWEGEIVYGFLTFWRKPKFGI